MTRHFLEFRKKLKQQYSLQLVQLCTALNFRKRAIFECARARQSRHTKQPVRVGLTLEIKDISAIK